MVIKELREKLIFSLVTPIIMEKKQTLFLLLYQKRKIQAQDQMKMKALMTQMRKLHLKKKIILHREE